MLAGSYFYFLKSFNESTKFVLWVVDLRVERIVSVNAVLEMSNIEICFLSHCFIDHWIWLWIDGVSSGVV